MGATNKQLAFTPDDGVQHVGLRVENGGLVGFNGAICLPPVAVEDVAKLANRSGCREGRPVDEDGHDIVGSILRPLEAVLLGLGVSQVGHGDG